MIDRYPSWSEYVTLLKKNLSDTNNLRMYGIEFVKKSKGKKGEVDELTSRRVKELKSLKVKKRVAFSC